MTSSDPETIANMDHERPQFESAMADQAVPRAGLRDWLVSVPFFLVFFLVLIIHDVAQRLSLLFGKKAHQKVVHSLNYSLVQTLRLLGTRFTVTGGADLDISSPVIIVANHQSMFDIPLLYASLPQLTPAFISKVELGKWIPSISMCIRNDGSALIERKNPRQALPAIKALCMRMKEQLYSVVIFPEGTRARKGGHRDFRPTGFSILYKHLPDAPILPVTIEGMWKLTAHSRGPFVSCVDVHLVVGEPIARNGRTADEVLSQAQVEIYREVDKLRQ